MLHVDDSLAFGDLVATFLGRHDGIVVHGETDPRAVLERLDNIGFEVRVGPLGAAGEEGFFVEDDGPGFDGAIDPSELFDPGFSTDPDGTGYGLAIVRDIAEAHGWSVDATTGMRGGARFEFGITDTPE